MSHLASLTLSLKVYGFRLCNTLHGPPRRVATSTALGSEERRAASVYWTPPDRNVQSKATRRHRGAEQRRLQEAVAEGAGGTGQRRAAASQTHRHAHHAEVVHRRYR